MVDGRDVMEVAASCAAFLDGVADRDPVETLLWANGRVPLGDLPRRTGWRWPCAPLDS